MQTKKQALAPRLYSGVVEDTTIEIEKIRVESNFRRNFDPKALKELTDNIRVAGILQPILVRRDDSYQAAIDKKEGYILIAGERRLRAAKELGHGVIPARILDVNEKQAAEIQAFENLHREGINPIDEARSFKTLMEKYGHKAEELADRVSKSASYVTGRVRLLDLQEKVIHAIESEQITAAHGAVIARLQSPEEQISFLQSIVAQKLSAKAAENSLARCGRDLAKATFDKTDCVKCPYNGKRQKDLFDKDTDLEGRCMNPPCYDQKTKEAKGGSVKKKTAAKSKSASAPSAQNGFHRVVETIVEHVRKDSNLAYMRLLADGILRNSSDRVQYEFMRRRNPSIKKSDAAREIRKYVGKLTDFFVPGFCVEMTILSENQVKEGELVHQFKKLYGISKANGSAGAADKSVQAGLKAIGAQIVKDEKAAKAKPKKGDK
jgi:ParB/RepB/Spo0J family partition protein